MNVQLEFNGQILPYDKKTDYPNDATKNGNEFMKHMKLDIKYVNPVESVIKQKVFNGTFLDFTEGAKINYSLDNNRYIDLVYTVKLDDVADNRVQGISASPNFTVITTVTK